MSPVQVLENKNKSIGVVLLNMGGPKDLEAVRPFLYNLFKDPDIINLPSILKPFQKPLAWLIAKFRSPGTKDMYRQIGGGSPILEITDRLGTLIDQELKKLGYNSTSVVAMRYTPPRAEDAVKKLEESEIDEIVLFSQYPHYAESTTGSSISDFKRALNESSLSDKNIVVIDEWGLEEAYINWWVKGIEEKISNLDVDLDENVHLIFSAHGLPKRYVDQGEKYPDRIREAKEKIVENLGDYKNDITIHQSFQSQAGPIEWTKPYTDELIRELGEEDPTALVMVPLGFVSNHVETLYELDILYKNDAEEVGITNYHRVEVPDHNPEYVRNIAKMIIKKMEEKQ